MYIHKMSKSVLIGERFLIDLTMPRRAPEYAYQQEYFGAQIAFHYLLRRSRIYRNPRPLEILYASL